MELEEGKIYTNEELAQWFGITKKSFTNSRKKKLQYIIDNNADIEILRGKIKVLKVRDPVYTNIRDKEANNIKYQRAIVKVIQNQPLQLYITCTGRVVQLDDEEIKKLNHKISTSYQYVRSNLPRVAMSSQSYWCHRFFNGDIDFVPLTKEQLEVWKEIISEFYNMKLAEIESEYENGDLTKNEYDKLFPEIKHSCWETAKRQFKQRYGFEPVYVKFWELNGIALQALGIELEET